MMGKSVVLRYLRGSWGRIRGISVWDKAKRMVAAACAAAIIFTPARTATAAVRACAIRGS